MKPVIGLINSLETGGAERQMLFLKESGIISEVVTLSSRGAKWIRPFLLPWYVLKFSIKVSRGDTVISFLERSNFVNILSNFIVPHKTVISIRTNPKYAVRGVKKVKGFLMGCLYPYVDKVVANSQGALEFLVKEYNLDPKKLAHIPNAYDIKAIRKQASEALSLDDQKFFENRSVCVAVGRLEEPKGYENLMEAFQEVVSKKPEAVLLVIGEGGMRVILQEKIGMLGLEKNIFLIGARKNPFPFMKQAEMLVLSSLWEGMPNVVVEALICGTPVVSVDCDFGPRDILNDSIGILTQPTKESLAQGIVTVFNKEKLFPDFKTAVEKVLKELESSTISEKWRNVIEKK